MGPTPTLAPRLARLPTTVLAGLEVPVAVDRHSRLLGLAFLDRDEAGGGLLLPRCRSVHGVGMRFCLELVFLDERLEEIERCELPPGRCRWRRQAAAVLEIVPSLAARGTR